MKKFAAAVLMILTIGILSACGQEDAVSRQLIAMDTPMTFTVYGQQGNEAVQAAVEEVQRLEQLLSRTDPGSQVSQLNQAGEAGAAVGEELCRLLQTAKDYSQATGGAFDVTIAPVVSAWGFTGAAFQVPGQEELDTLLACVGAAHLQVEADTASLTQNAQIDLGGIAKGYAAGQVAALFQDYQITRGWAGLGGNVLAWGTRPDGDPWKVGIQDPKHPNEERYVGIIGLENAYAVTSGGYQRYFEADGQVYHHIIDPAIGYPAQSGLTSVTVVADALPQENGALCDALSTALFVMGEDRALDFWKNSGYDFQLVLVTDDDRVLVTSGLAFTPSEESGYSYETVG